jgi:integrase
MPVKFGQLFNMYFERHVRLKNKNHRNARYFMQRHGQHWAGVNLEDITRGDLQVWVDEIGVNRGKEAANRAINQMSAAINWAIKRGYTESNPCRGVERYRSVSRQRFLLPDEVERLKAALEQEEPIYRDFFHMCLLTGARKGNVLAMRWAQLDYELALWTIPADEFKNGETQHIPLGAPALAILERRSNNGSVWVFPGTGKGGHLADPKRAWKRILRRAGIDGVTIHDLRRTVGSYLAISGAELPLIAKTLGHKDMRSTQVYARLNVEPVRIAMQNIQDRWLA